jgi:glycosidase
MKLEKVKMKLKLKDLIAHKSREHEYFNRYNRYEQKRYKFKLFKFKIDKYLYFESYIFCNKRGNYSIRCYCYDTYRNTKRYLSVK